MLSPPLLEDAMDLDFLAPVFLVALFFVPAFLAGFLAAAFLGAAFLAVVFLAAAFLGAAFLAAAFLGFLAAFFGFAEPAEPASSAIAAAGDTLRLPFFFFGFAAMYFPPELVMAGKDFFQRANFAN